MNIRTLQEKDLDQLLLLYTHLHTTDAALPQKSIAGSIWKEILSNPNCHYFGGFLDNQLISSCTLTVILNLTWGCSPYGLIENVVTHRKQQNKGFGKALLAHTLKHAWSTGCYKVMLLTGRKDEATLHFYESAGFDATEKQAFIARPRT